MSGLFLAQRPAHPEALSLQDIRPGLRIVVHRLDSEPHANDLVVLRGPYLRGERWCADVCTAPGSYSAEDLASGRISKHDTDVAFLSDIGIAPHHGSRGRVWSQDCYVTLAPGSPNA